MERSFSLDFNPLTNVRSVKDYELELEQLRTENFELKARIAHGAGENVPKALFEQSERLTRLEESRAELARLNEELQRSVAQLTQERALLENKYNQELFAISERGGLLEEENKRLLHRLEKMNHETEDAPRMRSLLAEAERLNNEYKAYIQSTEAKHEQERFEHAQALETLRAQLAEARSNQELSGTARNAEIERLRQAIDMEQERARSNALVISDLKTTLSAEIKERNRLSEELRAAHSAAEQRRAEDAAVQRECRAYMAGMEKFGRVLTGRLSEVRGCLDEALRRVAALDKAATPAPATVSLLKRLGVAPGSLDQVVAGLRKVIAELQRRNEMVQREAKDATLFIENARKQHSAQTLRLVEDLRGQFVAAKDELLACRRYLEKKAGETKALRNENAALRRQLAVSGGATASEARKDRAEARPSLLDMFGNAPLRLPLG